MLFVRIIWEKNAGHIIRKKNTRSQSAGRRNFGKRRFSREKTAKAARNWLDNNKHKK
jgi:hypothetical protein